MKISVKAMLNIDPVQFMMATTPTYEVTYDDGVVVINRNKEAIFNRFCWDLFKLYPNTPITSQFDVKSFIGNGFFNYDTHTKFLEHIFKYICEYNNLNSYDDKDKLIHEVFKIVNRIYVNLVCNISNYVTTIDAVDFVDLVKSKEVGDIFSRLVPLPESVDKTYKEVKKHMSTIETKNKFVAAYRSKAINENQSNQCIGPRGYVTDVNRSVFKEPILSGFIEGLNSLYDMIAESLTATKALNASETQIKTSEYGSRRVQLFTMILDRAIYGDCGTDETIDLYITDKRFKNMKGVYYKNESGSLSYIKGDGTDNHLIGNIIKIRTPLGCKLAKPNHICTTCLGKVSENIKSNSNVGYTFTSYLFEKLTQKLLSKKHFTMSVRKILMALDPITDKYLRTGGDNELYFKDNVDLSKLTMILPHKDLIRLNDVLNIAHTNVSMSKIGELSEVNLIDKDISNVTPIKLIISTSVGNSVLSKEFIDYIKSISVEYDIKDNFVVDMSNFDRTKPVFHNQMKEEDILSLVKTITNIIEKTKNKKDDLEDKFINLFDTIIETMECNITAIGVLIYAYTAYNLAEDNYSLGRFSPTPMSAKNNEIVPNRSISQFLLYEKQILDIRTNPVKVFGNKHRENHPMDVLFIPDKILR